MYKKGEYMNKEHNKIPVISVKSQKELDMIPLHFQGIIMIEFGIRADRAIVRKKYTRPVEVKGPFFVETRSNASVIAKGNSDVEAWENSCVTAKDDSLVTAWEQSSIDAQDWSIVTARGDSRVYANNNSIVKAWKNSFVEAWDNSHVMARDNSRVYAKNNSYVEAYENSNVFATDNSCINVRENATVKAYMNSNVTAKDKSNVVAMENTNVTTMDDSSVIARDYSKVWSIDNSNVEAHDNSNIIARDKSCVFAYENSKVEARETSIVYGSGNVQIFDRHNEGHIETTGNARIVYMPSNVEEYCDFYKIEHTKETGKFFKCVHKSNGTYFSDFNNDFKYEIGKKAIPDSFDDNPDEDNTNGIHVGYLSWILEYGSNWNDLAVLEVEAKFDEIVLLNDDPGVMRCKEVTVLREIPLEECGIYGKILAKRRNKM